MVVRLEGKGIPCWQGVELDLYLPRMIVRLPLHEGIEWLGPGWHVEGNGFQHVNRIVHTKSIV